MDILDVLRTSWTFIPNDGRRDFATPGNADIVGHGASMGRPLTQTFFVRSYNPERRYGGIGTGSDIPESISRLFSGDETVSMVVEPSSFKPKMHPHKLIITNRRIVIYKPGFMGAETEEYPFESIDKIDHKKGFMRSEIEIHAGGKEIELENISNDEAVQAISIIRQNMHTHKLAQKTVVLQQPMQPAPAKEDPVTKLKQLKEMLDASLITEEEYNTKKADLLSRM